MHVMKHIASLIPSIVLNISHVPTIYDYLGPFGAGFIYKNCIKNKSNTFKVLGAQEINDCTVWCGVTP